MNTAVVSVGPTCTHEKVNVFLGFCAAKKLNSLVAGYVAQLTHTIANHAAIIES